MNLRIRGWKFGLLLSLCLSAASAAPITYTITDTATGSLAGVAFVDQQVAIQFVSDTSDIYDSGDSRYFDLTGSGFVTIGAGSAIQFTDSPVKIGLLVSQTGSAGHPSPAVSIFGEVEILGTDSTTFDQYDGTTADGPVVGRSYINPGTSFSTTEGDFVLTSAGVNSTFTAQLSAASVPEPGMLVLLSTCSLMAIASRRRAVRRPRPHRGP